MCEVLRGTMPEVLRGNMLKVLRSAAARSDQDGVENLGV
jgi:hypothetical protein